LIEHVEEPARNEFDPTYRRILGMLAYHEAVRKQGASYVRKYRPDQHSAHLWRQCRTGGFIEKRHLPDLLAIGRADTVDDLMAMLSDDRGGPLFLHCPRLDLCLCLLSALFFEGHWGRKACEGVQVSRTGNISTNVGLCFQRPRWGPCWLKLYRSIDP
jgi:hypothetical protein